MQGSPLVKSSQILPNPLVNQAESDPLSHLEPMQARVNLFNSYLLSECQCRLCARHCRPMPSRTFLRAFLPKPPYGGETTSARKLVRQGMVMEVLPKKRSVLNWAWIIINQLFLQGHTRGCQNHFQRPTKWPLNGKLTVEGQD